MSEPRPPVKRDGILHRLELQAMIRHACKTLGFELDSDDFTGVRVAGKGLRIERKSHFYTTVGLKLELQYRWCEAFFCTGLVSDGVAYTSKTQVVHYANGSYTVTTTQPNPGPHLYNPESSFWSCESTVETDNRTPGFDYGSFVSSEDPVYHDALDPATLKPLAEDNLVDDGDPYIAGHWEWTRGVQDPRLQAYDRLNASTVIDFADIAIDLGYWTDIGSHDKRVRSWKYRWINTGGVDLSLDWTQGGEAQTLALDSGETSDWYDDILNLAADDPDQIIEVAVEEL